eukprot:1140333-Pelagomonas_calceolata.AAC.1
MERKGLVIHVAKYDIMHFNSRGDNVPKKGCRAFEMLMPWQSAEHTSNCDRCDQGGLQDEKYAALNHFQARSEDVFHFL